MSTALLGLGCASTAWSAESAPTSSDSTTAQTPPPAVTTDPSYRLSPGDTIAIAIQGEDELSSRGQTISRSGEIRLTYITNDVTITGRTVREAERFLENLYREKKLLKNPVVMLSITAYSPREVSVLGAVRTPGTVSFPRDNTSMDLVDVITRANGFLPMSRQDAVQVTHRGADGKETTQIVNLENVISSRRRQNRDRAEILIYPGDRIFVPESLF